MIPLETGARMFTDEVFTQEGESVLISGNLGILDQNKSVRMAGVVLPRVSPVSTAQPQGIQ